MTPDGIRYWAMAGGQRVARPFHLRWVMPMLAGRSVFGWRLVTWCHVVLAASGIVFLALQLGASESAGGVAALLWLGLPSVRFALHHPVLVDAPTVAYSVWAALAVLVWWPAAIPLALIAGAVNERSPVFASLFAWNPLPLVGLLPVVARWLQASGEDPVQGQARWCAEHPVQAGRMFHAGRWRDPMLMVAPWGGSLAALLSGDWRVLVVVAVAYAQLLVATDSVRLYQQAAPVVCIAAAAVVPPALLPALVVAHWFNPWAGNGV